MRQCMPPSCLMLLRLTLLLLFTIPAGFTQAQEAELQTVLKQLEGLQQELNRFRGEFAEVERGLQEQELALASNHREVLVAERALGASDDLLTQLQQQAAALASERLTQEALLQWELVAIYQSGGSEPWKMLLNLEDQSSYHQMLHYYRLILAERKRTLDTYIAKLGEIEANQVALNAERQQRTQRLAQLASARQQLEQRHGERETALTRLEQAISGTQAQIAAREADKARLESLVASISTRMAELSLPVDDGLPFSSARGRCSWPVAGTIQSRFGTVRTGSVTWDGVLISTQLDANVNTIHRGRVVFADYLRGYGLLAIVDHGDNYLTLYGHNQSLLVEAGDWVATGSTIARAGTSGGLRDPSLYFEIRRNGQPENPANWCR